MLKVKPKTKVEAVPLVEIAAMQAAGDQLLVDEYEQLSKQIDAWDENEQLVRDRFKELKEQLRELADKGHKPDEDSIVLSGTNIDLKFGAKANSTEITNLKDVIDQLQIETFMKIAKVGIADLKAYLNPEELAQCTVTERTGNRSMKVVKRTKK